MNHAKAIGLLLLSSLLLVAGCSGILSGTLESAEMGVVTIAFIGAVAGSAFAFYRSRRQQVEPSGGRAFLYGWIGAIGFALALALIDGGSPGWVGLSVGLSTSSGLFFSGAIALLVPITRLLRQSESSPVSASRSSGDDISNPVDVRSCPWCAEIIKSEAVICKHCQRNVTSF